MIFRLFQRTPRDASIASLYGTIVAQARMPAFYQNYGVPDTVDGRFELLLLHMVLLLDRLNTGSPSARARGQAVFDLFCQDMDESLREMGVGDLAVPRTMRRIGEAFYGRQAVYRGALGGPRSDTLVAALARNVFGSDTAVAGAVRLAAYVQAAAERLAAGTDDMSAGATIDFPHPEAIVAPHVSDPPPLTGLQP